MGQTIQSATDMVSYAGDLRRAAKQAAEPEVAQKIQQASTALEQQGLAQVSEVAPHLGRLLDTLA